jgi:hypothetical protein
VCRGRPRVFAVDKTFPARSQLSRARAPAPHEPVLLPGCFRLFDGVCPKNSGFPTKFRKYALKVPFPGTIPNIKINLNSELEGVREHEFPCDWHVGGPCAFDLQ